MRSENLLKNRMSRSKLHKVEEWQRREKRLREYKDYSAQEEKFLKLPQL